MKENCALCGNILKAENRCPFCGFDRREDFVSQRTLRPAGKMELFEHMACRERLKLVQSGRENKFNLSIQFFEEEDDGEKTQDPRKETFQVRDGVLIRYWGRDRVVDIPCSVMAIGPHAFENCEWITRINIPQTVTAIGDAAFAHCSGLTEITIPDTVVKMGETVFGFCKGLRRVSLPENITTVDNSAFYSCVGLTEIKIPPKVETIRGFAFSGCSALTRAELSEGVRAIWNFAFFLCDKLQTVYLPGSVEEIDEYAFYGCSALANIIVPRGKKEKIQRCLAPELRSRVKEN